MVRCSTCNVFHMRQFFRFLYCLAWFDTVEFNRQPCPNDKMYDDIVFADRFRYQLAMFGNRFWYGYLDSFMLLLHMKYLLQKSSPNSSEFSIVCMIWYGWIQSPAVSKRRDVRWCRFRWSIPLSIGYVWHSFVDRVISTPSWSYFFCIWNRCFQNHRRIQPNILLFVLVDTV